MTSSAPILEVHNLSKRYCRGLRRSLLYGVTDVARELTGVGQAAVGLRPGEFWALRDVSFTVGRGESVGLIGHNGAGKTTILKLVNGLIKPNGGCIAVNGSVRALIALGAGFNPVLTGRENVKVACAVLGYTEREIEERFPAILDFSELAEAVDAPVQSFSSGMVARLGFAVAIHTQPDLLLVDEVLAVGDLNFAIKCYRRIADLRAKGVSFIIVNHNPYAIRSNCDRAVWIEHGEVQQVGEANAVCDAYEAYVARQDASAPPQSYLDTSIAEAGVAGPDILQSGSPATFTVTLRITRRVERAIVTVGLFNIGGQNVVSAVSTDDIGPLDLDPGRHRIDIAFASLPLAAGRYRVSLILSEREMNNQLAALLNCHQLDLRTEGNKFAVGMVFLDPKWHASRDS
jgi:homopolymeric O-antigen transport system ATP-binding protein